MSQLKEVRKDLYPGGGAGVFFAPFQVQSESATPLLVPPLKDNISKREFAEVGRVMRGHNIAQAWGFFGGMSHGMETLDLTLKREIIEEIQLLSRISGLFLHEVYATLCAQFLMKNTRFFHVDIAVRQQFIGWDRSRLFDSLYAGVSSLNARQRILLQFLGARSIDTVSSRNQPVRPYAQLAAQALQPAAIQLKKEQKGVS